VVPRIAIIAGRQLLAAVAQPSLIVWFRIVGGEFPRQKLPSSAQELRTTLWKKQDRTSLRSLSLCCIEDTVAHMARLNEAPLSTESVEARKFECLSLW